MAIAFEALMNNPASAGSQVAPASRDLYKPPYESASWAIATGGTNVSTETDKNKINKRFMPTKKERPADRSPRFNDGENSALTAYATFRRVLK